jgi:tetratricopeptide (TPR) repeat protein
MRVREVAVFAILNIPRSAGRIRRWVLCVTLAVVAVGLATPAFALPDIAEVYGRFSTGNKYYENGQFAKALSEYHALIEGGIQDPVLFYNAGNAYVQLEQPGEAVVMYERALRLDPRFAAARKNLQYVLPGEPDSPFILWQPFLFVRDLFSLNEWLVILDGVIVFVALAFTAWLLTRHERLRAAARYCLYAGLALALIAAVFTPWRWYEQRGRNIGVIVEKNVISHYGPSDTHAQHLSLTEGVRVEILGHEGSDWLCIRPLDVPAASRERSYVPEHAVERI